jgi:phosphoglycolate phosphatase-like HAD superfamily hydrolase
MSEAVSGPSTPALVVYVDVDDTLIRSYGSKRMPMPAVVEHVRALHREGAQLYCWSSGGAVYARQSAEELGIVECFSAFLPKPDVVLDDQPIEEWRRLVSVHPGECRGQTVEDYRARLHPTRGSVS